MKTRVLPGQKEIKLLANMEKILKNLALYLGARDTCVERRMPDGNVLAKILHVAFKKILSTTYSHKDSYYPAAQEINWSNGKHIKSEDTNFTIMSNIKTTINHDEKHFIITGTKIYTEKVNSLVENFKRARDYGLLYPVKRRYSNRAKIKILTKMAKYANYAYCRIGNNVGSQALEEDIRADVVTDKENQDIIVAYFRGRDYSRINWRNRPKGMSTFTYSSPSRGLMRGEIDSSWDHHVKEMMSAILAKFEKLLKKKPDSWFSKAQFWFTGHGIGGAYALLAALYFKKFLTGKWGKNWPVFESSVYVATFGAPRIGNDNFAELVNLVFWPLRAKLFRITHSNDWIPRDFLAKGSYRHHDTEYWIAEPDCNCKTTPLGGPTIDGKHVIYECPGFKRGAYSGENGQCNLNTTTEAEVEQSNQRPHYGPYFGVFFNDCNQNTIESGNL
ncbi:hypothetical protein G9A89_008627 [Geosiphon pyriformis]|nr:hypothetical protein G9A89_008627 [Geosiphon pyriformis]